MKIAGIRQHCAALMLCGSAVFGAGFGSSALGETGPWGFQERQSPPPLKAIVSIAEQKAWIYIGGRLKYSWDVSTASSRHKDCTEGGRPDGRPVVCETPIGTFSVVRTDLLAHAALKWHRAPMPHAVYIDNQGDAFHGTDGSQREIDMLGEADSHGCIRLLPVNAAIFYDEVEKHRHGRFFPGVTIEIIREKISISASLS